jgi:hypothetical protein
MSFWSTIRRLLPMLAIAGLVLAPVAQPVMAMPADMQATMGGHAEMVDHAAMAMPDGTPCCPHEQKKPDCGKDCPLMAMCVAPLHSTLPGYVFSAPVMHGDIVALRDDRSLDSLSQAPPPRPPKA